VKDLQMATLESLKVPVKEGEAHACGDSSAIASRRSGAQSSSS
jgi:hypothetical protein